jgi:hypothetical protein
LVLVFFGLGASATGASGAAPAVAAFAPASSQPRFTFSSTHSRLLDETKHARGYRERTRSNKATGPSRSFAQGEVGTGGGIA